MEDMERVQRSVAESTEMQAMERALTNGYRLYVKTRPCAAPGSLKRAKELPMPGPHPHLAKMSMGVDLSNAQAEAKLAEFTQLLKVCTIFVPPEAFWCTDNRPALDHWRSDARGSPSLLDLCTAA